MVAEKQVDASAANIANVNDSTTVPRNPQDYQGYTPVRVDSSSVVGGGASSSIVALDPTYFVVATPEGEQAYPNVDPANEMMAMQVASQTYQSNLAVINTDNEMQKSLMSIET